MKTAYSRITILLLAMGLAALASGCIQPGTGTTSFQNTAGNTSTIPGGPKAAQVIFTDLASSGAGSFNVPPSATAENWPAVQLFNPDGSRLTQTTNGGTADPNWPTWLNSVYIGITSSNCATFGTGSSVCDNMLKAGSKTTCDVASTYGVSEHDCDTANGGSWGSGDATGNGTGSDTVYIRANFNRANLGSNENLMVVVNYAASAYNPATATPVNCFNMGSSVPFAPENCADFTWRVFQTYGTSYSFVQPFLMLVPPMYSYVNGNTKTAGTTTATKQFIIPLAGDHNLNTIVFGRTGTTLYDNPADTTQGTFNHDCTPTGGGSPLCAGIVFYSMTFFRI